MNFQKRANIQFLVNFAHSNYTNTYDENGYNENDPEFYSPFNELLILLLHVSSS